MVTTSKYYKENRDKILAKNKEWRNKNKERHAEMNAIWYRKTKNENLVKYLLKYAKTRAKKKNLPFNLLEEDIIIPEVCPIFKVPFIIGDNKYCPSIDRIIPSLGYVKNNIQIICTLANRMKWDATQEELELFSRGIIRLLEEGNSQ